MKITITIQVVLEKMSIETDINNFEMKDDLISVGQSKRALFETETRGFNNSDRKRYNVDGLSN